MRLTIAVVAAGAATGFLWLGFAAAQPEEEPVRLEYHAPPVCDDDTQFFARARARAPRMRVARPDERARTFVVDIEQRGSRMAGRLVVRNPEGRQTVREIDAKDCNEAVDALALVVALVVNPRAGTPEAPPTASVETEPPPPPPAPPASAPIAPAPVAPTPPAGSATPGPVRDDALWTFRAGLGAWAIGAIAPEPLFGGRASAEMLNLGPGVFAPSFRTSFGYATHAGFVVDGGTAHFGYAGTSLEICPVRFPAGGSILFRPCVMADLGFVFARGSDALNPREETRPWADFGAGGRLEWMFSRRIGLDLDVDCIFPIWRDRFLFGPRAFHRVARVGGVVVLEFVMRIP